MPPNSEREEREERKEREQEKQRTSLISGEEKRPARSVIAPT